MHKLRRILKSWGWFEYLLAAVVIVVGLTLITRFSFRVEYIHVVVRVGNRELIYNDDGALHLFDILPLRPGLLTKDALGRVVAEIVDVKSFARAQFADVYGEKYMGYVTLKLRASLDPRSQTYKFRGTNLLIGDWIRVETGPVVVMGVITDIGGQFEIAEYLTMVVSAQLKTEDPREASMFGYTTGVDSYIAESITVGDEMRDVAGNSLAKIIDKVVRPASTITVDQFGISHERPNPRKKDVILTVQLRVLKVAQDSYFFLGQPAKVNSRLPLFLSNITIEPRITKIISVSP